MSALRIVDASRLVSIGAVLDIINDLADTLSNEDGFMLSGPNWNADEYEYDPATPEQVLSAAQDRVSEAREQIMWLLK